VVSLTSSSGGYINGRNSANLELLDQGYKKIRLIRSLKKFIFRYQDLVEIYSVSAEKISLTFTSLSLALLWQLFYLFCSKYCYKYCYSDRKSKDWLAQNQDNVSEWIRVITKLTNSYKGKVKTHKYILECSNVVNSAYKKQQFLYGYLYTKFSIVKQFINWTHWLTQKDHDIYDLGSTGTTTYMTLEVQGPRHIWPWKYRWWVFSSLFEMYTGMLNITARIENWNEVTKTSISTISTCLFQL
jgi:hypothetical protein